MFGTSEFIRIAHDHVQRLQHLPLLIYQQLGITHDVDEEDMRYFQRDLFFYFARHRRRHHSRFAGKIESYRAALWDLRVAVLGPERAAIRSPDDGKRSPVETY